MDIWQSSDRNNFEQFFSETRCIFIWNLSSEKPGKYLCSPFLRRRSI